MVFQWPNEVVNLTIITSTQVLTPKEPNKEAWLNLNHVPCLHEWLVFMVNVWYTSSRDPMGTLLVDPLYWGTDFVHFIFKLRCFWKDYRGEGPWFQRCICGFWRQPLLILLMEEILHHLGCIKASKWDIYHINWLAGFLPSTVRPPKKRNRTPSSIKISFAWSTWSTNQQIESPLGLTKLLMIWVVKKNDIHSFDSVPPI